MISIVLLSEKIGALFMDSVEVALWLLGGTEK